MPKRGVSLAVINKKLDLILKNQQKLMKEESEELAEESRIEKEEKQELSQLEKLKRLEEKVAATVEPHPLTKITYKDVAKGTIGAFIGVVAHFTFVYGIKVAHEISVARAYALFPLSLIIGGVFMYFTGFRKIKDPKIMWFLPVRLFVLYLIAILVALAVLLFFSPEFGTNWETSIKQLSTITLLGVIGSITADLLGKD
ncbi:MAG: DUF2391 family protein [Candidatus Aenigmarchaeota archaeon]|nr:DUF2391 family protein [Candidatus Aenigmarchaeota archaeon]